VPIKSYVQVQDPRRQYNETRNTMEERIFFAKRMSFKSGVKVRGSDRW